jgi:phosphoglycerate dehydrogenase-like enzyme
MAKRPRILVTLPWDTSALDGRADIRRVPAGRWEDAEGLLIGPTDPLTRADLRLMPTLRAVAVAGSGVDAVDAAALAERGIILIAAPEPTVAPTAELTVALMLMVSRGIRPAMTELTSGTWPGWTFDRVQGRDLAGLTLGLVGFGRIGRRVAQLAEPFGMRILHHTRTPTGLTGWRAELDELLRESDIVSLHVPLTDSTRHLMGREAFETMPNGSALINTSRGGVVDESALADALVSGRLSGAGIDVFQSEPGIPAALMSLPNLVVTPHIGSATAATREAMFEDAARALLAALEQTDPA